MGKSFAFLKYCSHFHCFNLSNAVPVLSQRAKLLYSKTFIQQNFSYLLSLHLFFCSVEELH